MTPRPDAKPAAPAHTPEPWMFDEGDLIILTDDEANVRIAEVVSDNCDERDTALGDAARIVACVNACAGIENPAALPALIEAAEACEEWLTADNVPVPAWHKAGGPDVLTMLRAALANVRGAR